MINRGVEFTQGKTMEKEKEQFHHGNEMTPEELEEHFKAFQEIEESIGLVMENGDDL